MAQTCNGSSVQSNTDFSGTPIAYLSLSNTGNCSSILRSCCNGAPVEQYSSDPCMVYCNVTAPASIEGVSDCVIAKEEELSTGCAKLSWNATESTVSPTTSMTSATPSPTATAKAVEGGAVRREGLSTAGWMVVVLGILGAVGGLL